MDRDPPIFLFIHSEFVPMPFPTHSQVNAYTAYVAEASKTPEIQKLGSTERLAAIGVPASVFLPFLRSVSILSKGRRT